jgi:hypothetical protein
MDAFVDTAVQVSLLQVRQLDLAQQLLAHQGAIAGSVALWMAQRAGLSTREAKQLCRVAKGLPGLTLIDEAFRGGRLSLDTADVLMKVATPSNEAVLLETAGAATGSQLRKIIATFKRVRDHDVPEPDRHEELTYGSDDGSMWMLRARMQPGHGGESEAALRAAKEDLWKAGEPDAKGKRPAVSNADAFLHLCRSYLERTVTAAGVLPDRFLTVVHVDLTRGQVAGGTGTGTETGSETETGSHGGDGDAGRSRPNRAQRRFHQRRHRRMEATRGVLRGKRGKRLRRGRRGRREERERREKPEAREAREARRGRRTAARAATATAGWEPGRTFDPANRDHVAWLRGIGAIDGNALERFLCDSMVSIVDHHGVDVTASAPVRLATPAQRRALAALHPTCQYPGCGRTQYLQAHHLIDYHPRTGPTALWNLVLVCDEHHDQLHQDGWSAALTDQHALLVWRPNGSLVNNGALRPARTAAGDHIAKSAKCEHAAGAEHHRADGAKTEQAAGVDDVAEGAKTEHTAGAEHQRADSAKTEHAAGADHVAESAKTEHTAGADHVAESAKTEPGAAATRDATPGRAEAAASPPAKIDASQRLHGVGDRMDAWALDTYLHVWLEATAA